MKTFQKWHLHDLIGQCFRVIPELTNRSAFPAATAAEERVPRSVPTQRSLGTRFNARFNATLFLTSLSNAIASINIPELRPLNVHIHLAKFEMFYSESLEWLAQCYRLAWRRPCYVRKTHAGRILLSSPRHHDILPLINNLRTQTLLTNMTD